MSSEGDSGAITTSGSFNPLRRPPVVAVASPVHDITALIGDTPLIALPTLGQQPPIVVKHEGDNPGGSVRDRTVREILDGATATGLLRAGDELVVAGATNSAVSAAMLAGARGHRLTVFHPRDAVHQLVGLLRQTGAAVHLLDLDMDGCVVHAANYANEGIGRIFIDGRRREALVDAVAHIAHEILTALDGRALGAFVTSVSTGSTLRHVAGTLRQFYPELLVLGVTIDARPQRRFFYADVSSDKGVSMQSSAAPETLSTHESLVVSEQEAWQMRDRLARQEGLLVGPKGASAILGALSIVDRVPPSSVIVALSIDAGHRYLGYEPSDEP